MNIRFCIGSLALLLALSPAFAAEPEPVGRLICDWSQATAGEAPARLDHVTVASKSGEGTVLVVDDKTTPPTPFSDHKPALYVNIPEGARAPISIVPFSSAPLKGWVEVDVSLMNGKVLVINPIQTAGQPSGKGGEGTILANIFLRPNNSTLVRSMDQAVKVAVLPKIDEGAPTTVRMAWDFTQQPPTMTFLLNGQPGVDATGQPVSFVLDKAVPDVGIDKFRITPFEAFIGNMRASE